MVMKNHCNIVYSQQDIWWIPSDWNPVVSGLLQILLDNFVTCSFTWLTDWRSEKLPICGGLNCTSVRAAEKVGMGASVGSYDVSPISPPPVSPLSSSPKPPTKLVSFNNSVSEEGFWVSTWVVGINEPWSGCGRKKMSQSDFDSCVKVQGRDTIPFLSTWARRRCWCARHHDGAFPVLEQQGGHRLCVAGNGCPSARAEVHVYLSTRNPVWEITVGELEHLTLFSEGFFSPFLP